MQLSTFRTPFGYNKAKNRHYLWLKKYLPLYVRLKKVLLKYSSCAFRLVYPLEKIPRVRCSCVRYVNTKSWNTFKVKLQHFKYRISLALWGQVKRGWDLKGVGGHAILISHCTWSFPTQSCILLKWKHSQNTYSFNFSMWSLKNTLVTVCECQLSSPPRLIRPTFPVHSFECPCFNWRIKSP